MAILLNAYWQAGIGLGNAMTKRGEQVATAVSLLEGLLKDAVEPTNERELVMSVKFWTAYAICKADHSARLLTDVHKSGEKDANPRG
jgi:hypothetical protein